MLKTADLAEWFTANGSPVPVSMDTLPDTAPVKAAAVRITGGLGLQTEGVLDTPTFALYVRGNNGKEAEETGLALDAIWLNGPTDFVLGGYQCKGRGRFGGPPSFVARDDNGKVLRTATYWLTIER